MDFPSAKLLTSMQNPLVKQVAKWRDRHDRDADQKVLIEGYRALTRAMAGHYPVEQLFIEVNPIPVKAALNMQGFDVGSPRLPLTELTDAHKKSLRKAMEDFGVL